MKFHTSYSCVDESSSAIDSCRRSSESLQPWSWSARRASVANTPWSTVNAVAAPRSRQRELHHGLAVVGVGVLPAERVHQPPIGVDLPELSGEEEAVALGWLHLDAVATSHPHVEVDARSREPLGAPPSGQPVRLGVHPEDERPRRLEHTLQMHGQLTGHADRFAGWRATAAMLRSRVLPCGGAPGVRRTRIPAPRWV